MKLVIVFCERKQVIIRLIIQWRNNFFWFFLSSHIFVINWVAPLLGILGGLLFALTYSKTKSLLLVSFEHALYGNTLFYLCGLTQHAGLAFDVKDHRINTRTVILNPILSWLYIKLEYHIEHHMFPQVPWYNLPKLHNLIKDQLPKPNYGLVSAYKDIIPSIIKQAYNPNYTPDRKIPNTV